MVNVVQKRSRPAHVLHWLLGLVLACNLTISVHAETYTINFNDTEIAEMIRFVADATGETFLVDPRVKGRIQVISSEPVDDNQLYDLFLAILEINGYTSIRAEDGIVNIVPIQDGKSSPGPVGIDANTRTNREIRVRVIPLKNISANKLVGVVRPLLPARSHLSAYPPTNSLIIADNALNINKLMRIIERLDQDTEEQVDIVRLKYAEADSIATLVKNLDTQTKQDRGSPLLIVSDKRTNSLLIKGGEIERERALELIARLDSPAGQISNARVIYLKHADAQNLAPILNKVISNIVPEQSGGAPRIKAQLEAHEATNSLIVTAEGEVLKTLEAIIDQLDVRRAQVLVEAIIVEVMDNDLDQRGIELFSVDSDSGLISSSQGLAGILGSFSSRLSDSSGNIRTGDSLVSALASGISGVEGGVIGFGDYDDGDQLFSVLINALKRSTRANVLSTPNLLTLENTEAYIIVGQNVPFITGSFNNENNNAFQTISRRDVGTTLRVTPYINEGDTVLLNIEQEVSTISGDVRDASDIVTNQRKISTSILAGNKETVVLGGLISDTINHTERRVPILGSLPLLGRLFRSRSERLERTNLLVFIKPTIIRNSEDANEVTAEKYRYIRDIHQRQVRRTAGSNSTYNILPTWEERIGAQLEFEGLSNEPVIELPAP